MNVTEPESLYAVCANVVTERKFGEDGAELRRGTRHFRGGAKVHVIDAYWGTCEVVTAIGHHRASGRYVRLDVPVKHLENFRRDRLYSPTAIALIHEHFAKQGGEYTDEHASRLLEALPLWKADFERR